MFEPANASLVAALQSRIEALEREIATLKAQSRQWLELAAHGPEAERIAKGLGLTTRAFAPEAPTAQRKILARGLVAAGWTYQRAAGALQCTERTIQRYLRCAT